MNRKTIVVAFYRRVFPRSDWQWELNREALEEALDALADELAPLGVELSRVDEEVEMEVRGYADLLNSIRIRSPRDGIGNLCLGHIIGASSERDLPADIRRGVNRVAFAPETIEPEGSSKVVCHNCGCGC